MVRKCKGKSCSRFVPNWDNHSCCAVCRVCSQDNPCEVCSVWTTCLWSKASSKTQVDKRGANLDAAGETVQQVGVSRDSSLPSTGGSECPVVDNRAESHSVVNVEAPSAQALALTGPNLGAQSLELTTGDSSQPPCQRAPDFSGTSRPRFSKSPEFQARRHEDRSHGSRARSRRSHRSRSGSSKAPRAYRVRHRSRSFRPTKYQRSMSSSSGSDTERYVGGSRASSRSPSVRSRRSRDRRSRRDYDPRSNRGLKSRRGHRSRSSHRPHHRHRYSRSYVRNYSPSSRSSSSCSSSRDTNRPRDAEKPRSQSSNQTSEFSGFSAPAVSKASELPLPPANAAVFPPLSMEHGVQPDTPDLRSFIQQLVAKEFNSLAGNRKRPRSRSVDAVRISKRSHTVANPDPDDGHSANFQGPENKTGYLNHDDTELQITPFPGETIGSDEDPRDSDDQSQDKDREPGDDNTEQSSGPQLPYIEALESLRTRLGTQLCPDKVPEDPKTGASALDFFDQKSKTDVHPALPQSRLILDVLSKLNSRIQGEPIQGSPLDSYPKGLQSGRFPSVAMKPKFFSQDSYKISDPTMAYNPPPLDPSFREVMKQGASMPNSHAIQITNLESWERLARAAININSHADMFLYGILSALNNSTPSQSDLTEVRRYLQALAQSHMHLFGVLLRLASGPLLARRDAFLDKCALDSSTKSSLRVQPIEAPTLFGPKMPEVAKVYKEDLTRRSLQNAAANHPSSKKPTKKSGPKSESVKLVVNTSDNGRRQVVSKEVQVGKDQEKAQSEKDSHSKNRGGKKPN